MSVSMGNGVDLGNLVTSITDPVTGKVTNLTTAGRDVIADLGIGGAVRNTKSISRSLSGYCDANSIVAYLDRTYRLAITVPVNFVGARLVMRNPSLVDVVWPGAIYMAPSNAPTGNNPSGSWTQVKFNGGETSFTIPAGKGSVGGTTMIPGVIRSDWIPVQSVARTDGTVDRVLYVSGYVANTMSSMPTIQNTSAPTAVWLDKNNTDVAGRTFETRSQTGNLANSGSFAGTVTSYGSPFFEVEFLTADDCFTLLGMGDSLTNGDGPTMKMASHIHFAAVSLTQSGKTCVASNHGFSSQNTNTFIGRLNELIANGSVPDVVVYSAWSPNDFALGQAKAFSVAQMKENTVSAVNLCKRYGIKIVLTTAMPCNIGGEDSYRTAFNTWLLTLGVPIADYSAVVADPVDNTILLESMRTDQIHLNLAGYKAVAAALAATVLPLLS